MSKFRDRGNGGERTIYTDFAGKMRAFLNELIQMWRNGMDMNEGKKGLQPFMLYRSHSMDDEVFDLGCKIHDTVPELDHKLWIYWMMNTQIKRGAEGVSILFRSDFFKDMAAKKLGALIDNHFGVPVRFLVDRRINMQVEQ